MALKLLVYLAVLKLALSAPDPNPDPNINVVVDINVNENNGNGDLCCLFGGKSYTNGATLDTCMVLKCCDGSWIFIDKHFNENCGHCEVDKEPQIFTYETNTNNDLKPSKDYQTGNEGYLFYDGSYAYGNFVLSQPGLHILGKFGVNANFTGCENIPGFSCVNGLTYHESGIEIILEDSIGGSGYPLGNIKVFVKGLDVTNQIGQSVTVYFGTVLVFKSLQVNSLRADYPLDCINIVGSKGLTVNYCHNLDKFDSIWIYAMKHLRAVQTAEYMQTSGQLYGLCDQYTVANKELTYYTRQDGAHVSDSDNFASSWKI